MVLAAMMKSTDIFRLTLSLLLVVGGVIFTLHLPFYPLSKNNMLSFRSQWFSQSFMGSTKRQLLSLNENKSNLFSAYQPNIMKTNSTTSATPTAKELARTALDLQNSTKIENVKTEATTSVDSPTVKAMQQISLETHSTTSSLQVQPITAKPTAKDSASKLPQRSNDIPPVLQLMKLGVYKKIDSAVKRFRAHPSSHTCAILDRYSGMLRPLRIIVSSTSAYLPVALNWLLYFGQLCPDRSSLYFICLDKETEEAFRNVSFPCAQSFHSLTRNHLWFLRIRLASELVERGYDVLLTDTDAVWIRNPFDVIEQFAESDIITSRGNFPQQIYRAFGATICMGFIYFKSTKAVRELLTDTILAMTRVTYPDDQYELNYLLVLNYSISYPARGKLDFHDSVAHDTGVGLSPTGTRFNFTLLAHETFRRHCEGVPMSQLQKSVVLHCLGSKNATQKSVSAAQSGVWGLKADFEKFPTEGTLDEYLHKISALDGLSG
jgi:hypothetical protein